MSEIPDNPPTAGGIPLRIPTVGEVKDWAQQTHDDAPPEVQKAVEKTQSFYEANKKTIHAVLVGVVVLKVYKRKVARASAKTVVEHLAKDPQVNLPTMFDIWSDLKNTPGMAYIPHSGGMVHLLAPSKDKKAMLTIFGDFTKMNNDEIWAYVGSTLGIRGY